MNLYDIVTIENEIDRIAKENDGEISEEQLKALVEAETTGLVKVEGLVKYIRHLELFDIECHQEIKRILDMRNRAARRVRSIKQYMTPYVLKKGKIDVGTFKLSTTKSETLETIDEFCDPIYMTTPKTPDPKVDKNKLKSAIKSGKEVPGAWIEKHDNLQIK